MALIQRWLPSDRIRFRMGFDGYEPAEQAKAQWSDPAWKRGAVAIGTWYPEVQGGFYFNRNLIGLIQESLAEMGIQLVQCEYHRDEEGDGGIEPEAAPGSLEQGEDYCLIDREQGDRGFLRVWEYWAAGHALGDYYSENVVVDVISGSRGFFEAFRCALMDRCGEHGVAFEDVDMVSAVPVRLKNGLLKKIEKLL